MNCQIIKYAKAHNGRGRWQVARGVCNKEPAQVTTHVGRESDSLTANTGQTGVWYLTAEISILIEMVIAQK